MHTRTAYDLLTAIKLLLAFRKAQEALAEISNLTLLPAHEALETAKAEMQSEDPELYRMAHEAIARASEAA